MKMYRIVRDAKYNYYAQKRHLLFFWVWEYFTNSREEWNGSKMVVKKTPVRFLDRDDARSFVTDAAHKKMWGNRPPYLNLNRSYRVADKFDMDFVRSTFIEIDDEVVV